MLNFEKIFEGESGYSIRKKMMKSKNTKEMVALAALLVAAGAATYIAAKLKKSLDNLENLELDFGNDSVLSSVFKKD